MGMATGMFAIGFAVITSIIYLVILFVDAKRSGLQAVNWLVVGLVLNLWSLPVYIAVRIKIAKLKCDSCGTKYGANKAICPNCGAAVKKIDDGRIAERLILGVIAAGAVIFVLFVLYTLIIGLRGI